MSNDAEKFAKELRDLLGVKGPPDPGSTTSFSARAVYFSGSVAEVTRKLEDLGRSSSHGSQYSRMWVRFENSEEPKSEELKSEEQKSEEEAWRDRLRKKRATDARLKELDAKSRANQAQMPATNNSSRFAPPTASDYHPSVSGSSAPRERYSKHRSRERNPPQHQQKEVRQNSGSSPLRERYSEHQSRERSPPQYQQREVQQYRQRDDHSREGSRYRNTSPFYQSETQRPIHEAGASRDAQNFPAAEEWARRQSLMVKKPMKDRWIWQSRAHPPYHKKVHLTKQRQAEFETRGLECLDHGKRFKITAVCGSCGHKHHYLCDCPIPDESGFVSGCPLCNTTAHDWDDCKRSGVLTWMQQYEIMFFRRINMPPIRSRKPWIMWEKERIDQGLWSWDLQGVYPWTLAFVRELKQSERPWVNFDHKLWKKERAGLPKDPATHLYSAEQLIDYAPLLEERSASSEDHIRNSGNTLQSGLNAAAHNTQTSQDVANAVATPPGPKREDITEDDTSEGKQSESSKSADEELLTGTAIARRRL
ncbi:hypothetical protein HER10_EVM0003469 [Colletotrichum scovillei]|uniref:uncharacterized protein n=1 Tax=Colletotrichum scovillei TaxID=1209932 RepID=UPI0015C33D1A|nr:uncharacterized protein HER10_EVM0003469 [Colletotrichum scovillei]KAF4778350.1 hypothetical protein HER10_EVM0003469 [Colletotrichum scovillei]